MHKTVTERPMLFNRNSLYPVLGLLLLTSCASSPSGAQTAGAQGQPQGCSNGTTTTLTGTAVGAGVGALAGGLLGHSAGDALIGAGVGGVLGTVAGAGVAHNNCQQATSEANTQQEIATAQAQTQQYQADTTKYQTLANEANHEADLLQAKYNAGHLSAADYRAKMAKYGQDKDALGQELATLQNNLASLHQEAQAGGSGGAQLQQMAQAQQAQQQQLQTLYNSLTNSLASVPQA
jgi:hypothetical protein